MRVPLLPLALCACTVGASKDTDTDTVAADTDRGPGPRTVGDTSPPSGQVGLELLDDYLLFAVGDPEGKVPLQVTTEVHPLADLTLTASSSIDGPLAAPLPDADGRVDYPTAALSVGSHDLAFAVADPDGSHDEAAAQVTICQWPEVQTFDANPVGDGWKAYDNAHWDPRGWMEITGFQGSSRGSIWYTRRKVDPGNVELRFRIATGGLGNTGADGYAVSVVDVPELSDLEAYLAGVSNGGCLGYGVESGCGNGTIDHINAFHLEFDTWANSNSPNTDPVPADGTTRENHVAVTLDGDPSNHVLWERVVLETAVPQWHDVVVTFRRDRVRVLFDGDVLLEGRIPGFTFDGGWIGVSGSTGWAYNEHRFDDLQLRDRCEVP
ncbi:MAG: hypothetical protein H6732_07315 [Alphaproteobacteria bacterium]|nr:hypothetical protein [Alphaproteobacteria bacterium]